MSKLSATTAAPISANTHKSKLPQAVMTIATLLVAGTLATGCSTTPTVKPTATVIMGAHTSL
jgi:hypothetical protein